MVGTREVVKFTAAVALLAIFADAAVGHALLWENDPYWTYWITKTLLIATVFGLGTAWLGAGLARGAVITAIHTLVLTIYYWSLSPIGLPSHPEWLDLEHTWVTGVPVHFGVIYLGYLLALWLWQRRGAAAAIDAADARTVARTAAEATVLAVGLVLVGGLLLALALRDFPGVTWFVTRLLVTIPFVLAWWALAGRDRPAAVVGGVTLAFVWGTYSHFLGPIGLPDLPLRILSEQPPPATVAWLSYRQEWLVAVPIFVVVFTVGFLLSSRRGDHAPAPLGALGALGAVVVLLVAALGVVAWWENSDDGDSATVEATGAARVERGAWYSEEFEDGGGELRLAVSDRNPRVTPLPPHDTVDLSATVEHPDGTTFTVRATQPLVEDPLGRHTTWWGVGLHKWHHGESGIGSPEVPAVRSEVAVFALGEVLADGAAVATGVPIHVMTTHDGALELNVGDPDVALPSLPDGHLRVVWDGYTGGAPQGAERARNGFGTAVLVGLLALLGLLVSNESTRPFDVRP